MRENFKLSYEEAVAFSTVSHLVLELFRENPELKAQYTRLPKPLRGAAQRLDAWLSKTFHEVNPRAVHNPSTMPTVGTLILRPAMFLHGASLVRDVVFQEAPKGGYVVRAQLSNFGVWSAAGYRQNGFVLFCDQISDGWSGFEVTFVDDKKKFGRCKAVYKGNAWVIQQWESAIESTM